MNVIIFVAICSLAATTEAAKLKPISKFFNICHRSSNEDELSKCVRNTVESARSSFIAGIPELGLLSVDPLHIDKMVLEENNGRFKFSQTLSNLIIYGLGDFVLKDIRLNLDELFLNVTMFNEKMQFEGEYEIDGQVLVLPIKGSGHASYNFTDVTTSSFIKFSTENKKGKTYLKIDSYKLSIEPKNARLHFSNLFNGDERLGAATNKFLNENWYEAFSTYRALPEQAFSKFLSTISGRVYSAYPIDELFPN